VTFVHEEDPGREAQTGPLSEHSVDRLACSIGKIGPQKKLHVLCLGDNGGIQLGDLVGIEPEVLSEVEEDGCSTLEVIFEGSYLRYRIT
jgi:hypothetical protein